MLILYTFERLHAGKAVYTAMFLAAAAGTVATQWLVTPMQRRFGAAPTIIVSFWLWTIALLGLSVTAWPVVAISSFFLLGAGDGLWRVLTVTLRQRITPNRLLGRVNAAYRMVAQGIIPLGAAFGGGMAKAFGVRARSSSPRWCSLRSQLSDRCSCDRCQLSATRSSSAR